MGDPRLMFRPRHLVFILMPMLLAWAAYTATPPTGVSLIERPPALGSGGSFNPVFSADGRNLAFVSSAQNLTANSRPSSFLNIYVHNLATSNTTLVSVNASGFGGGNEDSPFVSVSSNGQAVAFSSLATNLLAAGNDRRFSSYLRDFKGGTIQPICVNTEGMAPSQASRFFTALSGDGQHAVFVSGAANLVTNKLNGGDNIYVRHLNEGVTELVTVDVGGAESARSAVTTVATLTSISDDGRIVALFSTATNLVEGATNTTGGVYLRDLQSKSTVWVNAGVKDYFGSSSQPSWDLQGLSTDGSAVTFNGRVFTTGFGPLGVFYYDRLTQVTTVLATNAQSRIASLSSDGRRVAYHEADGLWLMYLTTAHRELICGSNSIPGVLAVGNPTLSANGDVVAFLGAPSRSGPWAVYAYDRTEGSRTLISVTTNGTPATVTERCEPAVSPDGQLVAYESDDSSIVAGDFNAATDIFIRDRSTGLTRGVTLAHQLAATGESGLGSVAGRQALSQSARHVAFTSLNNRLTLDDDNPWQDVFVLDRVTGGLELIRSPGAPGVSQLGFAPILSSSGRYIAWYAQPVAQGSATWLATNIYWMDRETGVKRGIAIGGVTFPSPAPALSRDGRWLAFSERRPSDTFTNVYLLDLLAPGATNVLVSQSRFGTGGANGDSSAPQFSADGQWVIFFSRGGDAAVTPLENFTSSRPLLFGRNLRTGEKRWVSSPTSTPGNLSPAPNWHLSEDGQYVVFESPELSGKYQRGVFRHDLAVTNSTVAVCQQCANASINASGRFIAYEVMDASNRTQILIKDMLTQQATFVSSNDAPGVASVGNGNSSSAAISRDGRYVVFASRASNLVSDDTNGVTDIFVHDRTLRATFLLSRGSDGAPGDGTSNQPILAADGQTVVFSSFSANFTTGDFNHARDVFVLRLGGPDTDLDGLDDPWEITYFEDLGRDGLEDFDGDGATDSEEYAVGTDPTNGQSAFKILSTSYATTNQRVVIWNAEPGRTYRIQYKRSFGDPAWQYLSGMVTATDRTAQFFDTVAPHDGPRFYRVTRDP